MAYPYLSDVFRDIFNVDIFLPLPMFGIFVGLAFYVAVRILKLEIQRKQNLAVPLSNASSKVPLLESIDSFAILAMVSGMLGARFFSYFGIPFSIFERPLGNDFFPRWIYCLGWYVSWRDSYIYFFEEKRD